MKRLLFGIAALALMLPYSSCKKEKDQPTDMRHIIGTWKSSYHAYDDNGNQKIDPEEIHKDDGSWIIAFTAAGEASSHNGIIADFDAPYSIIDGDLLITNTALFHIKKLSSSALILTGSTISKVDGTDLLEEFGFTQ